MVNNNGSRRVRTSALTRQEIAAAALRMFATEGLAGLSMRRLGSELGVHYSTLYWHISDKRELLRLVLDAVLADVPAPASEAPWRVNLTELFSNLRTALQNHPGAAVLLLELGMPGPNATAFTRHARELLGRAGLDERHAGFAYRTLTQFTAASVQEESAPPWSEVDRFARRERGASGGSTGEPAAEVPTAEPARGEDAQEQFAYGLVCLLDGIAAAAGAGRTE